MQLLTMTDVIGDIIDAVGPFGVTLLILAETIFPPIPSEAVLPLAGFFVERGELSFVGALLGATAGSLAGALLLYALGRYGGRPLVLRERRFLRVRERELLFAERWFERWGPWIVMVARVIPIVRSVISVPAGLMRMGLPSFLLFTAIGSTVWNAALIGAGWALGAQWEDASAVVEAATPYVIVAGAVVCVPAIVWWWRRRAALRATRAQPSAE